MPTALLCTSNTPLLHSYLREPPEWEDLQSAYLETERFVAGFDPELLVICGATDDAPAPYQIALSAVFAADPGGYAGNAAVAPNAVAQSVGAASKALPAPALQTCDQLQLDHRFSQTLGDLTGGVGARPTLTLAIDSMHGDGCSFASSRRIGTALGEVVATEQRRILFVASGGLSHRLLGAESNIKELALAIAREDCTAEHLQLNPDLDEAALGLLEAGDLDEFERWDPAELSTLAGDGMLALHHWVLAVAAHMAAGGQPPETEFYSPCVELAVGFAVMHGH